MRQGCRVLSMVLALSSCSKDNDSEPQDQLPPISTTGTNTAGCIINGKVLIPKNGVNSTSGFTTFGLTTGAGINFNEPIVGDDYWYVKIVNLRISHMCFLITYILIFVLLT